MEAVIIKFENMVEFAKKEGHSFFGFFFPKATMTEDEYYSVIEKLRETHDVDYNCDYLFYMGPVNNQ